MKRIIEGQSYNTDTATIVARYEYKNDRDCETLATLYQTRGGAFFIVHKWAVDDQWKYLFETMSRGEVTRLVATADNLEIVDEDALREPPEAETESEPGATLYVRMPASLKKRVDDAARQEEVSGNVWAVRCMERCLENSWKARVALGNAYWALLGIVSRDADMNAYPGEFASEAMSEIELAWKRLGFYEGGVDVGTQIAEESEDLYRQSLAERYPAFPPEHA